MTLMDVYLGALTVVFVWVLFFILNEMYPALAGLALAGAFFLGVARRSLLMAACLAVCATVLNVALLLSQWIVLPVREAGLTGAGLLLVAFAIICGAGWILGRLTTRLVRVEMPAQDTMIHRRNAAP
jgi:hypothetical protein